MSLTTVPPTPPTSANPPASAQPVLERLAARWAQEAPDGALAADDAARRAWLCQRSGMPWSAMADWDTAAVDARLVPFADGQRRLCLALRHPSHGRVIVLADPFDRTTRLWLDGRLRTLGHPPTQWCVGDAHELQAFYGRLERDLRALDVQADDNLAQGESTQDGSEALELSLADISTDDSPVVRFVNSTLYDALKARASDIHLETGSQGLAVRYRLDGVLQGIVKLDGQDHAARVISRLKVLANLDITERRLPQDGRLRLRTADRTVDVRVSVMPSLHGEDAVLRILDRYQLAADDRLNLDHLGFAPAQRRFIAKMARMPHGLFLVTGPTGSGKTTTLYAMLSEINTGQDKIVTIEDPVEYQLSGVLQIPVNEAKGLSFARGLRSILRHDPDKIMVGEMRDAETAQIAVQAALTGHQVFATVHANNVFDVIGRLSTMGVDPYNLVSALNGVLAQRLIRKVCTECAEPAPPDDELIALSELPADTAGWRFLRGRGCVHCRGTGYRGRSTVSQMLTLDVGLKSLIAERASPSVLREAARARQLNSLRDAALDAVRAGTTTLEEANRVTALEE
ncbi:GspE/PulE family protein [Sphaerotilus sp.]|uniref:GspE/PulE family protein n=1 Tax=Sphaerotilus sp. TaxID=2093942 RepID=UPI0025F36B86|nr:GspE/PulE family protein [Sphaerotilus sp.]